ncbi:MAG: hypothetical protein ACHQQR_10270 [Gemmatimonadales bacterium]
MLLAFALVTTLAVAPEDTLLVATPVIAPVQVADSAPAPSPDFRLRPVGVGAPSAFAPDSTPRRRRKAIEVSDAYAIRLKIHQIASYTTLPLFAAQAIVGQQLYTSENNGTRPSDVLRGTHDGIAVALGGLFVVNTVTGSWNWWETRHQEEGRTWRTVHAALMLISDGGFAYTSWLGQGARFRNGTVAGRTLHKNWAIGSASVALASYVMMLKPLRRD